MRKRTCAAASAAGLLVHETGGDPKTDQTIYDEACSAGKGGDPKTDHSLSVSANFLGDSPHSGELATQTAISVPASPGLNPDLAFDPVHLDGFPSTQIAGHEQRDGCPSSAELSEDRDGFPRPGDSEYSDTVFLRDFHTGENSERVCESDSGVQIESASRSRAERSSNGSATGGYSPIEVRTYRY